MLILLLALVVLGPEKLPEAIRRFGRLYGELKRMSSGFQSEFRTAFDEPLRELRETAQLTKDAVQKATAADSVDEPEVDARPNSAESKSQPESDQRSDPR